MKQKSNHNHPWAEDGVKFGLIISENLCPHIIAQLGDKRVERSEIITLRNFHTRPQFTR